MKLAPGPTALPADPFIARFDSWCLYYDYLRGGSRNHEDRPFGVTELAQRAGLSPDTINGYLGGKPLPWKSADAVAAALSCHPMDIWGNEWLTAA